MTKKMSLEIISHQQVGSQVRRLVLRGKTGARPGQFVQVAVGETHDPYLRRPISVHDCSEDSLTLLYRAAGRGTTLLSAKNAGDTVDIVGPLGNGFPHHKGPAVVVAGGIGAAPLYYLLRSLREAGQDVYFFYGARTKDELVMQKDYENLVSEYAEATDDGSAGYHGFVTELAQKAIAQREAHVFACGPEGMLRQVSAIAARYNRTCYVSLEARMACGVGACLGCVVPVGTSGEYKRVCVDGPVFAGREVFANA
ncbi:dihydroorotate dehydrogenase electron transfer subunit [Dethiobacter alkaliphilus]|uniref:Dihydroorotate dehydrogenase B (NAD(+)), electron transfer subunit n=1 Tax=Dethiobacter alkaliphilus AHT 1 TaxID=555088 RepID=C0GF15_DETAL|nr:dihydroorotate dehydrogenase electron transfer subunit [Dethiobacter alkaliphilus]EEG78197.1 oxidoreductase FAD/NAD(P)-binding domain protein [Dethiobacter alkaliphilus AHT 1]